MRNLIFITIIIGLFGCASDTLNQNKAPELRFENRSERIILDGQVYYLAWINVSDKTIMNEYLLDGESLTEWSSMMTAVHYSNVKKLKEIIPTHMKLAKSNLAMKPNFYVDEKLSKQHVIIEMYLVPKDLSYLEYNLQLFFEDESGVKALLLAQRLPFKQNADVTEQVKSRGYRMQEMTDTTFDLISQ